MCSARMKGSIHTIIMNRDSKIYVAGHNGLAGTAIIKKLKECGFNNLVTRKHSDLELKSQVAVDDFFNQEMPDVVILAAAKVGGIMSNYTYPADHIYENLMIECNVINAAYKADTKYLLFLGSVCIYPKDAPEPVKASTLLTGPLELTNEYYAIAKIAGIKLCEAYNKQYKTRYHSLMLANLYGPNDNFNPEKSHVIPGLIRRFHEAKHEGCESVEIWGTGKARREFLFSDDMADACLFIITNMLATESLLHGERPINIGVNNDISIRELAQIIKEIVGFKGRLTYNHEKPDGTKSRLMDSTVINELGWKAKTDIRDGVELTYKWFVENQNAARL